MLPLAYLADLQLEVERALVQCCNGLVVPDFRLFLDFEGTDLLVILLNEGFISFFDAL